MKSFEMVISEDLEISSCEPIQNCSKACIEEETA